MSKMNHFKRVSLLIALVVILMLPSVAEAKLACRSDPAVILSSGDILDIGATVSTLPWDVKEVHYELHIPEGISMVLAIHTPTWLTSQETFTVYTDQAPNQYKVATIVTTFSGNASVTADSTLVSATNVKLGLHSVSGMENTVLWVAFQNTR